MTLQERIQFLMKQQKISKAELARKLEKPYTTVDNWFKRNSSPNSEIITDLAIALNTSTEWLLTGQETIPEKTPEDKLQLLQFYDHCNSEGKKHILEHAEFIASKYSNEGKSSEYKIG